MRRNAVITALTCTVAVTSAITGAVAGTGPAGAAAIPTLAVAQSGTTDWQLTYSPGSAPRSAPDCTVTLGSKVLARHTATRTLTVRGNTVRPGRYPVRVRCGTGWSPVIWLYAPRGQINDIGTWASNTTAGSLGI
ncbi:hypothetical protein [Gordonia desulfuricans]|uniref:hypothetical protein n=1 Tax=Gordonia desulfuricans TaxID=89051 RepID=UPI00073F6EC5|nr:hypothetical protein [Gordonia desulfuricans]